jgi:hypothetical protein
VIELAQAFERLHHQPRALLDLLFLFLSSDAASIASVLNKRVERQLASGGYDALWGSLKPLYQRICMRVARGEEVTSTEARRQYAMGSNKQEVSPGTVSTAIRSLNDAHILVKASGARGDYRLDDPLFGEWLLRGGGVLQGRLSPKR